MRRALTVLTVLAVLALTGCATALQIPKTTQVPIAVSCINERIERPAFVTDAQLAAVDDYALVLELRADQLKRKGYEVKLEAQIAGCQ
jgi:hypothetical protein